MDHHTFTASAAHPAPGSRDGRTNILRPLLAILVFLAAVLATGCEAPGIDSAEALPAATASDHAAQVERGRYLVTIGGCHDCHTPWVMGENGEPAPDMTRELSGHPADVKVTDAPALTGAAPWEWAGAGTNTAFAGPWGVSFAFNLTPDENTGTGVWTEEIFMNTIRSGRHWGQSRPILPPMPWFNYRQMTDDDLKAVFAYLQSIPPIHNPVPEPLPPMAAPPAVAAAP